MASFYSSFLLSLLLLLRTAWSLEVTPGSSCSAYCMDPESSDPLSGSSSSTNTSKIVCRDEDFSSTENGLNFKSCIECLQKSQKVNDTENDVAWLVYNLRYTVNTCLFGFPEELESDQKINSPCVLGSACQPLGKSFKDGGMDPEKKSDFGYCDAGDGVLSSKYLDSCVTCLQNSPNQIYLSNFVLALVGACEQKPQPGTLLNIVGDLFSNKAVNASAFVPTPLPGDGTNSAPSNSMTVGTIVGIAVGAALLFIGGTALFIVYFRRQKKLNEEDREASDKDSHSGSSITLNPGTYIPIDHKKSSSIRTLSNPEYSSRAGDYTSNADYYNKLEEVMKHQPHNFNHHTKGRSSPSAMPTHPAYIPHAMSRESSRNNTPTPPPAKRATRPDSYALRTYLTAGEEPLVAKRPAPPPPGAPTVPVSLPPPPPRNPPVPSLTLPSIPRIRLPKKYSPPKIVVENASPTAEEHERPMQISMPLTTVDQRFKDRPLNGPPVMASRVPQRPADYNRHPVDTPGSGGSYMYG